MQIPGVLDDLYASELVDDAARRRVLGQQADLPGVGPDGAERDAAHVGGGRERRRPVRHEAMWDAASGTWSVAGAKSLKGDEYLWEVVVYAPTTGAIETNSVTDPYSVALTTNSTRSVAIDLDDKAWQPHAMGARRSSP